MIRYEVDPDKKLNEAIRRASLQVEDLTLPLTLIAQSWYKTNQAIFALKGPGKYVDLKDRTKKAKVRSMGSAYPILLGRTGRLKKSLLEPGSGDAINLIINKNTLILGTKVPYAAVHQFGSKKKNIPARPHILYGAEQVAPDGLKQRIEIWENILMDYVKKVSGQVGEVK